MANPFDQFDSSASSANPFDQFDAPQQKPSSLARRAADIPLGLIKGVVDLPSAAVGLADIPTNGLAGKAVGAVTDSLGQAADAVGLPAGARPSNWSKQIGDMYSPEVKQAQTAVHQGFEQGEQAASDAGEGTIGKLIGGAKSGLAAMASNPSAIIPLIAENYGGMKAIAKGTAHALAPMAAKYSEAVKAGTMTQEAADAALATAAGRTAAVGEGLLTAGQNTAQVEQENPNATFGDRAMQGLAGAITGGISRGVSKIPGLGDVEANMALKDIGSTARTGLSGGRLAAAGKGVLSEGVLEELPQSLQEQVWQNLGTNKPWDSGLAEQGVSGLVAGAGMGGAMGLAHAQPKTKLPDAGPLSAAVNAGVDSGATSLDAPLALGYQAGPPLVNFPDGTTMTQAEYQQRIASGEQQRLDGMVQDNPLVRMSERAKERADETAPDRDLANLIMEQKADVDQRRKSLSEIALNRQQVRDEKQSVRDQSGDGSFSNMDELAGLIGQEKQDVAGRRQNIADTQELRRNVETSDADNRVADAMAKESAQRRRDVLNGVLADESTVDHAKRFAAELKRQGFRDAEPTESELATVQRFNDIKNAQPADPEAEPALPNELDAAGAGIKERAPKAAPQSGGRDKAAEIKRLVSQGWKVSGKTLVSPTGKKRNINIIERGHALNAQNEISQNASQSLSVPAIRQAEQAPAAEQTSVVATEPEAKAPEVANAPAFEQVAKEAPQANDAQAGAQRGSAPEAESIAAKPAKSAPKKAGPQNRDDLVGAILRVTGGNGIAANQAQTITGDKAGSANAKVRGLFTNDGTADLGDVAMLLRDEEGYHVTDGDHLSELIREQAAGNPVYSMERTEREATDNAEKQHKSEVSKKAEELGLKKIGGRRTLQVVEAEISKVEAERADMEAKEERAAIMAESVFSEPQEMTEAEIMAWLSSDLAGTYSKEEIDRAEQERTDRENARSEARTAADSEEQAQSRVGERAADGATEAGARATEGFGLASQTNEQAAEQFAQQQAREQAEPTKAQADRERDAVPFSLGQQSQPKPQGVQTGLFTADGRATRGAATSDKPAVEAGSRSGETQERTARAVNPGSSEPVQSVNEAGGDSYAATIPLRVQVTALAAAQKEQDVLSRHDLAEEIRSIDQNGMIDLSALADNPAYWDAENEEYTPAGYAEVDRLTDQQARDNLNLPVFNDLPDLDGAHQFAQVAAMEKILDGLGISYDRNYSFSTSRYIMVHRGEGAPDLKLRFADHLNTAKGQPSPDVNVAPGGESFTHAVNSVLHIAADSAKEEAKQADSKATADAGEELTYNKRNRRMGGLKWDDIKDKNAALRVKEVVKSKVYPKPDYQALVDGGMRDVVAHIVKQAYDSIAPAPKLKRGAEVSDEALQSYISGVNRVMDGVMKWANDGTAIAKWSKAQSKLSGGSFSVSELATAESLLDTVYPGGWKTYRDEIIMLGGNKMLSALQPGHDEVGRALKDIKLGWPAKSEAWQKQGYKVVNAETIDVELYAKPGRGDSAAYVSGMVTANNQRVDSFMVRGTADKESPEVQEAIAEKRKQLEGNYVLVDKVGRIEGIYPSEDMAIEAAREKVKRESGEKIGEKGVSVAMAERLGIEHRLPGDDVSSERLKETFGFRGVNFGNWMQGETKAKVNERQLHLNHLFDAFMDLAQLLNVPPKAMSLNGMLGIAVGAQGSGKALAHFVPGVNEINVTRTKGAGALAHEWGHALDHYFATMGGLDRDKEPYLSAHVGTVSSKIESGKLVRSPIDLLDVRPEVAAQFQSIVNAMTKRKETEAEYEARIRGEKAIAGRMVAEEIKEITESIDKAKSGWGTPAVSAKIRSLAERIASLDYGDGRVSMGGTDVPAVVAEIADAYEKASGVPMKNIGMLGYYADRYQVISGILESEEDRAPREVTTDYKKSSNAADAKKKPYWSTKLEMFARAFDAYVVDSLAEKAAKNTYLSGIEAVAPQGDERKAIGKAFDFLFAELQTKETEKGIALYSQGESQGTSIDRLAAESRIKAMLGDKIGKVLLDSGIVTLVNRGSDYQGVTTANGKIALNLDALSESNFDGVLQHEGFHSTINDLIGEETHAKLMKQLDTLLKQGNGAQWVKDARAAVPADTKAENVAEEIGAYAIEQHINGGNIPGALTRWAQNFLSAIRAAIIQHMPNGKLKSWAIANITAQDLSNLAIAGLKAKAQGQLQAQGREAMAYSSPVKIDDLHSEFWSSIKAGKNDFTKDEIYGAYANGRRGTSRAGYLDTISGKALSSPEAARVAAEWDENISGFKGYVTTATWATDAEGLETFYVSVVPKILWGKTDASSAASLNNSAIMQYAFSEMTDGTFDLHVNDVAKGSEVERLLKLKGRLQPAKENPLYQRAVLDSQYTETRGLMQEAIRRLALAAGIVPTVTQSQRDTGARAGSKERRVYPGKQVESKFSKDGQGDSSIRYSRASAAIADYLKPKAQIIEEKQSGPFAIPRESKIDDIIYAMQDKQVDLKRVVDNIKKAGGTLNDGIDPYLQEELFHGRSTKGVDDFLDFELKPLINEMRLRNIGMADFEEYLWNRHAEERNQQIAKINAEMPDGGSGIKTADAKAYLDNLPAGKKEAYSTLAKRVDAINKKSQDILVVSGLEKQATIDAWNSAYSAYVPLHRDDVDTGNVGTGKGYSIRGSSSKRATGSGKPVVDVLANIAMQRERNVVRAEKNRMSNALLGLAEANPHKDIWTVDDAPTERAVVTRGGNDEVVTRIIPGFAQRDNVIHTRIDGEDHYVIMNEREPRAIRMAQAIKNLDADQLGRVLSATAKATRYMAAINTQYNPVFGVVNLTRDSQTAMLNLSTTELKGQQKKVIGYTLSALRGIYADVRAHRKGEKPTSEWAGWYESFKEAGGQTGFRDQYENSAQRGEAIQKELNALDRNFAFKKAGAVFDWLSDYNEMMENAVRVAAYRASVEHGVSNERSASLAKNLTVNFNRKGQVATQMGALYAFFNASVQGTARLAETMTGPAGKKIFYGGLLLGAMQAMLLASAGMGDDEPPEFVRERSLILPIGDGKYISIPMPLGFHIIPNLARIPTEFVMAGFKNPANRIADLFGLFADTFNPIGNAGLSLQTIAPTVVDPLAALSENRDWTGKPIAKADRDSMNPTPGYLRTKDTATTWSKGISYSLNLLTGGTDYKKGLFSPTPDQIDYLIGQATGGVGREAAKIEQTISSMSSGEDLPIYKIPLVGRFVGDTQGKSAETGKFYSAIQRINEHENEIKGMAKNHRGAEISEYIAENPEAKFVAAANHAEREIQRLNRVKHEAVKKGNTERVKQMESAITQRMNQFNGVVERLSK